MNHGFCNFSPYIRKDGLILLQHQLQHIFQRCIAPDKKWQDHQKEVSFGKHPMAKQANHPVSHTI